MINKRKFLKLNASDNSGLLLALLLFLYSLLASANESEIGRWDVLPYETDVPVLHGAVLKTGKVLMFAGGAEAFLPLDSVTWDPQTGQFSTIQTIDDDLFCSHHVSLPDGRLLVNGGDWRDQPGIPPHIQPHKASYVFDPDTESWTKVGDMNSSRWYPTTLALPGNQGVITFEGESVPLTLGKTAELYRDNAWTWVNGSTRDLGTFYPGMHLLPNKKILHVTARWSDGTAHWTGAPQTALYDVDSVTWTDIGYLNVRDRTEGMSVALPGNRVMVIGGRGDGSSVSTNAVEIIDFDDPNPQWETVAPMNFPRRNVNAVLLPTGKVIVTAGVQEFKFDENPNPVLVTEEFDPDNENDPWTPLAAMSVPRHYHSVSLLLPDARVLNLGGWDPNNPPAYLHMEMEIFSPPYLFQGARPLILSVPTNIRYGKSFNLQTPDAASISKVVLVRPGSVTHHTDTEQRVIPLSFSLTTNSTSLRIDGPDVADQSIVGGYYMLFILNGADIPSVAKFVHLQEAKSSWLNPVLESLE